MNIVNLPVSNIIDIPNGLRKLADDIESGKFNNSHQLAWVIDCGDAVIECGFMGASTSSAAEFNLLLDLAKFQLLNRTLE